MQRKKLLAIGLLALALVLVLLLSFLPNRSGQASACQNLIYSMEDGDVEGTYAMLSDTVKAHVSLEQWQEQVDFVQRMYIGREDPPELIDRTEETVTGTDEQATIERYRIVTEFGPWEATCTFYESSGDQVGGFETDIGA